MIKNYTEWLNESWLENFRETVLPVPQVNNNWKKAKGNVTPDTMKLLELLEKDFDEVAIFSWHPNIRQAQYTDGKQHFDSNYNSRTHISGSIICKYNDHPDSSPDDGFRTIEKAVKAFPYMKTMGGSGNEDHGKKTYQVQISFLTAGVGTHGESSINKESKLSHGAYSLKNGEWMFIPVSDFDVTSQVREIIKKDSDSLIQFFTGSPLVDSVQENKMYNFSSSISNKITVKFEKDNVRQLYVELSFKGGKSPTFTYEQKTRDGKYQSFTLSDIKELVMKIHEQNLENGISFLTKNEISELRTSENFQTFLDKYLFSRRGYRAGKKFGV